MKFLKKIIMPMICLVVAVVIFAGCSASNAKISSDISSNNKNQRSAFVEYDNSTQKEEQEEKEENKDFDIDFQEENNENQNQTEDELNDENQTQDEDELNEETEEGEDEIRIKDKLLDDLKEIRERYKKGPIDAKLPAPIPTPRPVREEK